MITGEIDAKSAPEAKAKLMPAIDRSGRLLMDMSGVTFMSSAGLRILLQLYRQALARDGKVALVGLQEQIRDTMSMTGFLNYFAVADTLEEGLKRLSASS